MSSFSTTEGFTLFSAAHITTVVIIALSAVLASVFYRKSYNKRKSLAGFPSSPFYAKEKPDVGTIRHPAVLCIGIFIFAADIFHYLYLGINGLLSVNYLPLHLCSMSVYLVFLHSIFPADWLGQTLYALCLPGAWCAILFPDWVNNPFLSYTSLRCFIIHGLIVTCIIMQTAAGVIRPRLSAVWKPSVFLCIAAPFVLWINSRFGTNYMFLSAPPAGSPLVPLFNLAGGSHPLYLLCFGILTICGMSIMMLPFSIYKRIRSSR